MKKSDQINNNKTVLITGASSGIGYELSKLFAQTGYNLVLVARDKQRLEKLANELKNDFGISTKVVPKDLSIPESPDEIFTELKQDNIHIDILVNNAAIGVYGVFATTELKDELKMIRVNLISLTCLTKLFLPAMLKRKSGKIMNVSSCGSSLPLPYESIYGATKAYVTSFSETIAEELMGTGVTVTALCPGVTRTEFIKRAQLPEDLKAFKHFVMDAKTVAEIGYKALMKGKRIVIPGTINKLSLFIMKFMPRKMVAGIVKNQMTK